jgi:heme-degrading monooxygenase HmoA
VNFVVLARATFWFFKTGKRDEGFAELDRILNTLATVAQGFRGYMSLLSYEDPNALTVLTLWQDEESMKISEKGIFTQAVKKVQNQLQSPPRTENYRVFSTQLFQHQQ